MTPTNGQLAWVLVHACAMCSYWNDQPNSEMRASEMGKYLDLRAKTIDALDGDDSARADLVEWSEVVAGARDKACQSREANAPC